jgi:putative mycofactocin binding protein MftB
MDSLGDRCFKLKQGVRVRRERFGLLFYSRNGPKLTFVYSGPWICPEIFSGQVILRDWLHREALKNSAAKPIGLEAKISRALSKLVDKGLIFETLGDA